MPSPSEIQFTQLLRNEFRVEFETKVSSTSSGYLLKARPVTGNYGTIVLEATLRSKVRLEVRVRPEMGCAAFIETLAAADLTHKMRCRDSLISLEEKTDRFIFRVNSTDLTEMAASDWPDNWSTLRYEFLVLPLGEHNTRNELLLECFSWVVEAFRPIFDLLEVVIDYLGYEEGDVQKALVNKYERDGRNRELCLEVHGYKCAVCGFDFEAVYGPLGKGFIHVHHVVPVSQLGEGYLIDPVNDLIPVCPNCHSMLHRVNPPLMPDDLKKILSRDI